MAIAGAVSSVSITHSVIFMALFAGTASDDAGQLFRPNNPDVHENVDAKGGSLFHCSDGVNTVLRD
jgi:hypothetical protein